ncbi:MAG: right-handed parallel beta-helix repeat-containing protein, partial [Woeseiaceae bacterium]|nr:right-handed parallel beta-helix repeat-containing protein [Woeseiaceae bacterium]
STVRKDLTTWLPILLLVVLGGLAGIGKFLQDGFGNDERTAIPDELVVSSRSDRGPGSLRTALFTAMKAPHKITIRFDVDQIDIEVPLPPVAVSGIKFIGNEAAPTLIRFASNRQTESSLLKVSGDDVLIEHLHFDANGGVAIDVTGKRTNLRNLRIANASIGIDGFDVTSLTVENSVFRGNGTGIRLNGEKARTKIAGNTFEDNRDGAIWLALSSDEIQSRNDILIHDNIISGGRDGLIAVNAGLDVRGNRISQFTRSGITLLGTRAMVTGNLISDSAGIGMHISQLLDSVVVDNEIARNQQIGILIVDAQGLQVDQNHVYENGYGIAAVGLKPINATLKNNTLVGQAIDGLIAIGESPFIDSNHALRNRQAGIRIMDLALPDQPLIEAVPRLANNTMSDNGDDDVQYGEYVVSKP